MKYLIIVLTFLFSSCSNKTHVITEMDGEREVRWYSRKNARFTHDSRKHVNTTLKTAKTVNLPNLPNLPKK